ncbi:MAG: YtxH domain-containing protein [Bacteroidota bacterium]
MSKSKVLLGVAVGAAVGTALGVLIAPAKGSITKKKLLRKGAALTGDAKEKIGEYSDVVTEEYDVLRKGALNLLKKGKKNAATLAKSKK